MKRRLWVLGLLLLAVVLSAGGCETPALRPTGTPCPMPTPEYLWVEPITSPTSERSQVVTVHMGNTEMVTITAESGVFTATGSPARVVVDLFPNTAHHLDVVAQVMETQTSDGCLYGGYTLRTKRDRDGAPLTIVQGQPVPRLAAEAITPGNAARLEPLLVIAPDARLIADFDFSDGTELITVGYADRISRWDVVSGEEAGALGEGADEAAALCLAVHPGRSLLATGGTAKDPGVRIWNTKSGDMRELGQHETYLESLAFSASGTRLASGDTDNTVKVWEVASGQPFLTLEGDVPGRLQAFHTLHWPDDKMLVAVGSDAVYWWHVTASQLLERIDRPDAAAFFVDAAVAQQGDLVAAVAQDNAVYIWQRGTRTWDVWQAHGDTVLTQIAISPDEELLASASSGGELLLWEVATGKLLASYEVSSGDIAAVRFSPDGRLIAVGGWNSPIWLWGVP